MEKNLVLSVIEDVELDWAKAPHLNAEEAAELRALEAEERYATQSISASQESRKHLREAVEAVVAFRTAHGLDPEGILA